MVRGNEKTKQKSQSKKRKRKHKRSKSRHRSDGDSEGFTSSSSEDSTQRHLANARCAALGIRQILAYNYDLRNDLKSLARVLDDGDAVDLSGLHDSIVKKKLTDVFRVLPYTRVTKKEQVLKRRTSTSIVSFFVPFLDESKDALQKYLCDPLKSKAEPTHDETTTDCEAVVSVPPARSQGEPEEAPLTEKYGKIESHQIAKRTLGPAMPPPEYLAAAATLPHPKPDDDEDYNNGDGDHDVLGPLPPEYEEEPTDASEDARSLQVARIMKLLADKADPYEILGVEPTASGTDIKKVYKKMSFLVHPDKCDHAQAHSAFQAVMQAAQHLQNNKERKKIDILREKVSLEKAEASWHAQQERIRQWKIAKGEEPAGLKRLPQAADRNLRDAWMTELPPEKSSHAIPVTDAVGTQVTFSKTGHGTRGDTSGWTARPGHPEQVQSPAPLELPSSRKGAETVKVRAAVDLYNAQHRKKTLVEQHQENLKAAAKKAGKGESDATEWKPFDREQDLGPGLGSKVDAKNALKAAPKLSSRFTERSFL